MQYTYAPTHPRAGQTTTVLADVWQCPKCNYTSNLASDIQDHKDKAARIKMLNGRGVMVTLYMFAYIGSDGETHVWERYGETMEKTFAAAKNAATWEDKAAHGFRIASPQTPCGIYDI
jgi:hypothetical protein